jgi:hypothetical protein
MSSSHKGSILALANTVRSIDGDTTFLAHYDFTANEVLTGIEPTTAIYTQKSIEGKFGGCIQIDSGGRLVYPNKDVIRPDEGCISLWCNVNTALPNATWRMALVVKDGGYTNTSELNQIRMGFATNPTTWHWKITKDGTNTFYVTQTVTSGWHMFTINWSKSQGFIKCYYDGNLVSTSTDITQIPTVLWDYFYLGEWSSNYYLETMIDELRIDRISRTDDEIKSWFVSNAPFYPRGIYTLAY